MASSSRDFEHYSGLAQSTDIAQWELEALFDSCVQRNCLDKLDKLLSDYKKYFSGITSLMIKRQESSSTLRKVAGMLVAHYDDELMVYFAESLKDLSVTTSKLLYAVTCLRLLQRTPRPLFYEDLTTSIENMKLADDEHTLSLQESIKSDAELISKAICSSQIILEYCIGNLPRDILAVSLINFLQSVLQESADSALLHDSSTEMALKIVDNVCNVLICEDKVESSFWAIQMTQGRRSSMTNPLSSYPILIAPYGADEFDTEAIPGYKNLLQYYEVAKSFLNHQLRQIVSGKQPPQPSVSNEPKSSSYVEKYYSSFSNKKTQSGNAVVAVSDVYTTEIPSSLEKAIKKSQTRESAKGGKTYLSSSSKYSSIAVDMDDAWNGAMATAASEQPPVVVPSSKQPKSQPPTPNRIATLPTAASTQQRVVPTTATSLSVSKSSKQLSRGARNVNGLGTGRILTKVKAVRIMQKWIRLLLPKKRLSKYRFAKSLVFELVDVVVIRCYVKKAMKKRWARELIRCKRLYEMERAVIVIQKNIRRFIVIRKIKLSRDSDSDDEDDYFDENAKDRSFNRKRQTVAEVKSNDSSISKFNKSVQIFQKYAKQYFCRKAERRRLLHLVNCSILIQRVYRGSIVKRRVYDEIIATFKLQRAVYRRIALRKLKADVARFERPIILTVKRLKCLPTLVHKYNEGVRFLIKVYNNPLLHILAPQDIDTFLVTSKPSVIIKSKLDRYEFLTENLRDSSWASSQRWGLLTKVASVAGLGKVASQYFNLDALSRAPAGPSNNNQNNVEDDIHVDFNDEKILIPAVHGKSVLKFEFYNGDSKFAQYYWYLYKEIGKENFMFWKCEFCRDLSDGINRRKSVNLRGNDNVSSPHMKNGSIQTKGLGLVSLQSRSHRGGHMFPGEKRMQIEVVCTSGLPFRTNASVCLIKMGSGTIHKDLRSQFTDIITRKWSKFYISFIENNLYIFDSKRHVRPRVTIQGDTIVDVYLQLSGSTKSQALKTEDTVNFIIRTNFEEIVIRFADRKNRCNWSEIFTNAFADRANIDISRSISTKRGIDMVRESVGILSYLQRLFFGENRRGADKLSVRNNKSYYEYIAAYRNSLDDVIKDREMNVNKSREKNEYCARSKKETAVTLLKKLKSAGDED